MLMWFKRIFFFLFVNLLIVIALAVIAQTIIYYFDIEIGSINALLIFYSLIGMGGAFISLWLSKWTAVKIMKVQVISATDPQMHHLVEKVQQLSVKAGLPKCPDVGVYDSPEINAFATGPSKKNSLVAVSTGLLNKMNEEEVEGVLAHEVAHIANGDMVTMCLIQGIVNTMVFIIAHILSSIIVNALFRGRNNSLFIHWMVRDIVASIIYIPASMAVCYFSRIREYRADKGGARFAGSNKMISALQALQSNIQINQKKKPEFNYLMISNKPKKSLIMKLFSTHPPLEDRIERLKKGPSII